MSLSDLQNTLQASIQEDGTLVLGPETLGAGSITELFNDFLGADQLALSSVVADALVLSGDETALNVSGVTVDVFELVNLDVVGTFFIHTEEQGGVSVEELALALAITLPSGWTFSQSFPSLLDGVDSLLLDQLDYAQAVLVLASAPHPDEQLELNIVAGLTFGAQVSLQGPFAAVNDLVSANEALHLVGNIQYVADPTGGDEKLPTVTLFAAVPGSVSLGPITLRDLDVELGSLVFTDNQDQVQFSYWAALNGIIQLGTVSAELTVNIPSDADSPTEFTALLEGAALPNLGDVANLVGGDDLETLLPQVLQDAGGLSVTELRAGVSFSSRQLHYVSLTVVTVPWVIVEDVLEVTGIESQWQVTSPTQSANREISGYIAGGLAIAGGPDKGGFELQAKADLPEANIEAWLVSGQTIKVAALLEKLISGLDVPDEFDKLAISLLTFSARPKFSTYSFAIQVDDPLDFGDLGFGELGITSLALSIDAAPGETALHFDGGLVLFGKNFLVTIDRRVTTTEGETPENLWTIGAQMVLGDGDAPLSLTTLVSNVLGVDATAFRLGELNLEALLFEITRGTESSYVFQAAIQWDTGISLTGDGNIVIQAAVDIRKEDNQPVAGTISGALTTTVPYFENLKLSATYTFGQATTSLAFQLQLGTFELTATYTSGPPTILTFAFGGDISFGDIITFLVGLVDPDTDEFVLDPPWDLLNEIKLSDFELVVNTTDKKITVTYSTKIDLGFMSINSLGFTYQDADPTKNRKRSVFLKVNWTLGGVTSNDSWDAVNESPPEVPGKGASVFDVQYLGIGQHVTIQGLDQLTTITQIIDVLQGKALPVPRGQSNQNPLTGSDALAFSAESGLFLGARMSLLRAIDLSLIFNDPVVYGLRLSLYGPTAKVFAGLEFEILYRRISDTIGVYHVALTVPDVMRYLFFGSVAITLPIIVVDVFTNGDFKLDLGFPWNSDFSRSFALEILPFTGAGGIYFNKLSAATATSLEQPINGVFNPIFEFGLGLKIGLGKSFNKGPLSAEVSITVQGILEGVISWFYPEDGSDKVDYIYLRGSVSLVGRIYGKVDFEVIKVDVEVIARATVRFIIELFNENGDWGLVSKMQLTLEAEVSVKAKVTVAFIEVKFSFSLTVTESFTIGTASQVPWTLQSGKASPYLGVSASGTAAVQSAQSFSVPATESAALAAPSAATRTTPEPAALTTSKAASLSTPEAAPATTSSPEPAALTPSKAASLSTPEAAPATTSSPEPAALTSSKAASLSTTEAAPATTSPTTAVAVSTADAEEAPPTLATIAFDRTKEPSKLTWQPVPLWTEKPQLDVYFQPAFSRNADGLYGVALLFLENSIPLGEVGHDLHGSTAADSHTDFDTLAMSLLAWALYAYYAQPEETAPGGAADATASASTPVPSLADVEVTQTDLQNLYNAFTQGEHDATNPFDFDHIIAFLDANFTVQITDAKTDISSTIFPMIPALAMQVGSGTVQRFDALTLNENERTRIEDFFETLRVRTDTTTASAPPSTSGTVPTATFIFVEYFALLIRTAVQQALDHLQDQELEQKTLSTLLDDLDADGTFSHLAGLASRYLLHGLRLPLDDAGTTAPLYTFTGQQFSLAADARLDFPVTLSNPDGIGWISFLDFDDGTAKPSETLVYTFPQTIADLLDRLAADPTALPETPPAALPVYADEPHRFTFRDKTDWQAVLSPGSTAQTVSLIPFPPNLRAFQATRAEAGAAVELGVFFGEVVTAERSTLQSQERTDFAWATRIPLTIRRVPQPGGGDFLDDIYLMVGADEDGRDLLEALLLQSAPLHLFLLHETDSGLDNDPAAAALLLQTNLSTSSTPDTGPAASLVAHGARLTTNSDDFVRLLWEGSTVGSGGYFLHYRPGEEGLPDTAFADGLEATLVLLALLEDLPPVAKTGFQTVLAFHNSAVFNDPVDLDAGVLYAESTETTEVLSLPAGHLGFALTRANDTLVLDDAVVAAKAAEEATAAATTAADANPDDATAAAAATKAAAAAAAATKAKDDAELKNLYQMLNFVVEDSGGFEASNEALPLGPLADDPTTDEDDDEWRYERVLPVFRLATSRSDKLLEGLLDPYAGIGNAAQITLAFAWQDVYGNRLTNNVDAFNAIYAVRYVDPLIGVNQWPSVAESFWFEGVNDAQAMLHVELAFDAARFETDTPPNCGDSEQKDHPICAALETYRQIYYQLHQPRITFTVETSVLAGATIQLTPTQQDDILTFVDQTYSHLSGLVVGGTAADAPPPVTLSFDLELRDASATLRYPALIFPVTAKLVVERPADEVEAGAVPEAQRSEAALSPNTIVGASTVTVAEGKTFTTLVADYRETTGDQSLTVAGLVAANEKASLVADVRVLPDGANAATLSQRSGLSETAWQTIIDGAPTTRVSVPTKDPAQTDPETFGSLVGLFQALLDEGSTARVTLNDVAAAVADTLGLLTDGTVLKVTVGSLRSFAKGFEEALPGLHLAVGRDRDAATGGGSTTAGQLWAVHLDDEGIDFDIVKGKVHYFALAPMARTLLTGTVQVSTFDPNSDTGLSSEQEEQRAEAVDLNVLARDFLVAVEDFLDPSMGVPAYKVDDEKVEAIIEHKRRLADAIAGQVRPILQEQADASTDDAREAIRQKLLVDLVAGYDIETILKFDTTVTLNGTFDDTHPPRLSGQPVIRKLLDSDGNEIDANAFDFTLSPANVTLEPGTEENPVPLTFLFDTKTPEKYEGIKLDLVYRINEIEHDIEDLTGIADYQASSWLSFVRPLGGVLAEVAADDPSSMGTIPLPIPLRSYPMPPSMVFQRAEPDPDSEDRLEDVRQWQYRYTYEHLDVAQDTIESIINYNLLSLDLSSNGAATGAVTGSLFQALVRFARLYPQLLPTLQSLRTGAEDDAQKAAALAALAALAASIDEVAEAWTTWTPDDTQEQDAHAQYQIDEEDVRDNDGNVTGKTVTVTVDQDVLDQTVPEVFLPGFALTNEKTNGDEVTYTFTEKDPELAALDPVFGESSIPDRTLLLRDRDVIAHQNAWAAVWLVRNKELIVGQETNPVFLFETPKVRFRSLVTPLIVNDEVWNVAALPPVAGEEAEGTLEKYVRRLFAAVLPAQAEQAYDLRVACQYAFALVEGNGLGLDPYLLVPLPVLLGPRFTILTEKPMLEETEGLRANLVASLNNWLDRYDPIDPEARGGRFVFSISLFSNLDPDATSDDRNLPLLIIENIELLLEDIG